MLWGTLSPFRSLETSGSFSSTERKAAMHPGDSSLRARAPSVRTSLPRRNCSAMAVRSLTPQTRRCFHLLVTKGSCQQIQSVKPEAAGEASSSSKRRGQFPGG